MSPYDWMNGEISADALCELQARVAAYAPRVRQIERFFSDPSQREVQYFICLLEAPESPCQQRMGMRPRLDPPIARQALFENVDLSLRVQLTLLDRRMAAGLDDAWTPSLWPLFGNNHCTGAFGCQEEFVDPTQYPWVHPALTKPEDVYSVAPDLGKSRVAQRILLAIREWRDLTSGQIPIRLPDLIGPNTAASQVFGSIPSLEMVITHPDELHRFLQLFSDITLEWIREEAAAAGDSIYWGTSHVRLPPQHLAFGSDSLVLLSPTHIEEFAVPYYRQLAQDFDGFTIHYCGGNTHLLPVLKEMPGFVGVDSQFSLEQYPIARRILGPEPVILSLVLDAPSGAATSSNHVRPEFLREYLEMIKGDRTIIWLRAETLDEAHMFEEMIAKYGR